MSQRLSKIFLEEHHGATVRKDEAFLTYVTVKDIMVCYLFQERYHVVLQIFCANVLVHIAKVWHKGPLFQASPSFLYQFLPKRSHLFLAGIRYMSAIGMMTMTEKNESIITAPRAPMVSAIARA